MDAQRFVSLIQSCSYRMSFPAQAPFVTVVYQTWLNSWKLCMRQSAFYASCSSTYSSVEYDYFPSVQTKILLPAANSDRKTNAIMLEWPFSTGGIMTPDNHRWSGPSPKIRWAFCVLFNNCWSLSTYTVWQRSTTHIWASESLMTELFPVKLKLDLLYDYSMYTFITSWRTWQ